MSLCVQLSAIVIGGQLPLVVVLPSTFYYGKYKPAREKTESYNVLLPVPPPPAAAIINSRPVLLHLYLFLVFFTCPWGWGERRVGSLGGKSSPVQDSRVQRARPEPQKDHDLVKPREKGDTRLEKGKFGRPQEPSSNFGKVIQEQTKCISTQELQGDEFRVQLEQNCGKHRKTKAFSTGTTLSQRRTYRQRCVQLKLLDVAGDPTRAM